MEMLWKECVGSSGTQTQNGYMRIQLGMVGNSHGSAEEAHPQVQNEACDRSLSRHVSHPRKRAPLKVPNLLLFSRHCRICRWSVGVDSVCLHQVLMEDRVPLIFWTLHTLKFQVFFTPCERDMTEHIFKSMIFPTLHEVRSNYALTQVCGRTITCMVLHFRTAVVLAFSLTTHEEHR